MIRVNKTSAIRLVGLISAATLLAVVSTSAFASMITYNGVTFETQGDGTATISGGDLLLKPTGNNFALHVNRIPNNNDPSPINANNTPFISFSYEDTGGSEKIDGLVQDEAETGSPRVEAGSLFSATKVASATYGDNSTERNNNEEYLFFDGSRAQVSHDVLLGRTADGTLYTSFDGEQRSSNIFKDQGIDFDFNDFYLRARNASGKTIRFTDLAYGDDFSPSAQAVPEPGNLLTLSFGLGLIGLLLYRRRNLS